MRIPFLAVWVVKCSRFTLFIMLISGLSKFGNASKDFSSLSYDYANHKYTSFQGFSLVYERFFFFYILKGMSIPTVASNKPSGLKRLKYSGGVLCERLMTFTQLCVCQSVMFRINSDTKIYKRRTRCYSTLGKTPIEAFLFWWSRSTSCKPSLPSFLSIYVRKRHCTCVCAPSKPMLFTTCHCCRYVRFE